MNPRRKWLASLVTLASISLTSISLAQEALAGTRNNGAGIFNYQAYYGGLTAVEIEAKVSVSEDRYEVSTVGRSIGFLDLLFPFQSSARGTGPIGAKGDPRDFDITSTYRGKSRRIKGTSTTSAAPVWTVTPPIPLDERDPVPNDLRMESQDPMAALVAAATRGEPGDVCGGTAKIYNGKVRTNVHLTHVGSEVLTANHFSSFSGPAEKCEARYETLAGAYKKSWFGSDAPPPVIQLWIARIDESAFWVPVRVEASAEFAKVLVHLTDARIGTKGSISNR